MNSTRFKQILLLLILCSLSLHLTAQQEADTAFRFSLAHPAYTSGLGPLVLIDQAHDNFHTRTGRFSGFAHLLEQDGYRTGDLSSKLTSSDLLDGCRILVIANALDSSNLSEWALPTPSAFTPEEIGILRQWVQEGGSLFLIADHMPFAGAAGLLAQAFDIEFLNGFAFTRENSWPPSVFSLKDSTLNPSSVTTGMNPEERIDSLATFTGSAFRAPAGSEPLLAFRQGNTILLPDTAWRFNANTPRKDLNGYCQGAIMKYGKGRIAVFGEAAMFTAQIVNGNFRVGFNSELAPQNARFTLNLIHWLEGKNR